MFKMDDTQINEDNERISILIEESSEEPYKHILAFLIREGHLQTMQKVSSFAKAEKHHPKDVIRALMELLSAEIVQYIRTKPEDYENNLNAMGNAFISVFKGVLQRAIMIGILKSHGLLDDDDPWAKK